MKVYRWEETEHHHVAVLRPDELFDLATRERPEPDEREARIRARNLVSGEMEMYAMAYGKGYRLESLKQRERRAPDVFVKRDAEQLSTLRSKAPAKGLTA